MIKVCHVSTEHRNTDIRIFRKECVSLANHGYEVFFVCPGKSREEQGVHVIAPCGIPASRKERMTKTRKTICHAAEKLNAQVYHFHDPELLPFAVKMRKRGKRVIFDSHEDNKLIMLNKPYLPKWIRKPFSFFYGIYENHACKKLTGIICCYEWTKDRLEKYNSTIELIYNYPIIKETAEEVMAVRKRAFELSAQGEVNLAYAGGISDQWKIKSVVDAIETVSGATLKLAGKENAYRKGLEQMKGWEKVEYLGEIPFAEVEEKVYDPSIIGIAMLDYIPQCLGTEGNYSNTKLFEYMAKGMAVVCTDFRIWKEIIDKNSCGMTACPNDVESIRKAITYLVENPSHAYEMGKNGREAVEKEFNWSTEETKLLTMYKEITKEL